MIKEYKFCDESRFFFYLFGIFMFSVLSFSFLVFHVTFYLFFVSFIIFAFLHFFPFFFFVWERGCSNTHRFIFCVILFALFEKTCANIYPITMAERCGSCNTMLKQKEANSILSIIFLFIHNNGCVQLFVFAFCTKFWEKSAKVFLFSCIII